MSTLTGLIGGGGGDVFGLQNITNAMSGQSQAFLQNAVALGTGVFVSLGGTNNQFNTMLSVNASGYLMSCAWVYYANTSTDWRFRIKIDGTNVSELRINGAQAQYAGQLRVWPPFHESNIGSSLTSQQVQNAVCPLRFESSLLIEGYKTSIFSNSAIVSYVLD